MSNQNSNPKVALVTGASRGIGAAIARRLADDGFAVAINYVSGAAEADALVAELQQAGASAYAVQGDVSKADDVRRIFETVEQHLGKIDVVVNNAGILKVVSLAQTSDELFEQSFAINTRGVFNTLRESATRMNAGGRIINLTSTTLALNMPGYAIYNGTKAALESFTRVFAKELRGRSITVKQNGIISLAGPVTNIIIAFIFGMLFVLLSPLGLLKEILISGMYVNFFLAAFNMIPIFPLDGSKVLTWNAIAWIGTIGLAALGVIMTMGIYG